MSAEQVIGSLDVGTSSTRIVLFRRDGSSAFSHQIPFVSQHPHPGWVEHDPVQIITDVRTCLGAIPSDKFAVAGLGVTNHRETTVAWSRSTGKPLANAVVWNDSRTSDTVDEVLERTQGDKDAFREKTGLPISSYFSAFKLMWLLKNVRDVRAAADTNDLMVGTVDSWVIWNLTGGLNGGVFVTDVTNASRTFLMNIQTLQWDDALCEFFGAQKSWLADIRSSSEHYGHISQQFPLHGVSICGCLGDQQAACVGQMCFEAGMAKNTYGTGCFLLINMGEKPIMSKHGMLTTVCYQFGRSAPAVYALEGSIAVAGSAVAWLKDKMGLFSTHDEFGALAESVEDTGDLYFVPAFSGLFAPYWDTSARGIIVGITQYSTRAHLCRAALEAVCFSTKEIIDSIESDTDIKISMLSVDGGMTSSNQLCQIQADVIGMEVIRETMVESTAFGAGIAAGLAVGFWKNIDDVRASRKREYVTFHCQSLADWRTAKLNRWKDAVEKSLHWIK